MNHPNPNRLCIKVLLALCVFFTSSPSYADFQILSDFTQQVNISQQSSSDANSGGKLIFRSLGFSTRLRYGFHLLDRGKRSLVLLVGPYAYLPVLNSLTGYGSGISQVQIFELGGDITIDWFQRFRTVLTGSPSWNMTYESSALNPGSDEITQFTYNHWSAGLRLEVPVITMESAPGDRLIELGAMVSYQLDRVKTIRLTPKNFTDDGSTSIRYNEDIKSTQEIGSRWLFGIFVNARI